MAYVDPRLAQNASTAVNCGVGFPAEDFLQLGVSEQREQIHCERNIDLLKSVKNCWV